MARTRCTVKYGFTITELIIAIVISTIMLCALGIVLANSQRGWNAMYENVYSDVLTDSRVARRKFDSLVRRSVSDKTVVDSDGEWVEVYYFNDSESTFADRYARFYESGGELKVEHGTVDSDEIKSTTEIETVCANVSSCIFKRSGRAVEMVLLLDNGSQSNTVVCSAYNQN